MNLRKNAHYYDFTFFISQRGKAFNNAEIEEALFAHIKNKLNAKNIPLINSSANPNELTFLMALNRRAQKGRLDKTIRNWITGFISTYENDLGELFEGDKFKLQPDVNHFNCAKRDIPDFMLFMDRQLDDHREKAHYSTVIEDLWNNTTIHQIENEEDAFAYFEMLAEEPGAEVFISKSRNKNYKEL